MYHICVSPHRQLDARSYRERTDEELMEKCKRKDHAAFQELMDRYMRIIFNFARHYSTLTEEAEDITQDTFFKVWKYVKKYSKGRSFRPWIFTIARNTALDQIKKKKAMVFSDLDDTDNDLQFSDTLEDPEPLAHELFENAEAVEKLKVALESLHPDHKTILVLHYKEEMTFDEIADVVKKPMNTVKSWHRRALIRLRNMLAHQI